MPDPRLNELEQVEEPFLRQDGSIQDLLTGQVRVGLER